MNKKQYNNVIDWTVKHEPAAQTEDSLATARAVFNNMGVALPNGTMEEVYKTIKTDKYMGWKSCTMQQAQAAADKGTAAIGISKDRIVVLSATDDFCVFPPACAPVANRPVIGIVTKCDDPGARPDLAKMRLELCGCERVFLTSSYDNQGVQELLDYLK